MNRHRSLVVGAVLLISFTFFIGNNNQAFASSVTIVNPSFEDQVLSDGQWTPGVLSGWDIYGSASQTGAFDPTTTQYNPESIIPDGENVAYSNGGAFCQDLTETLKSNVRYTLQVDVGQRADTALAGYEIHLRVFDVNGQETLAGVDSQGINNPIPQLPAPNSFVTNTVIYETGSSHPREGDQLRICIVVDGTQTNFDNVRLTNDNLGQTVSGEFAPIDSYALVLAGLQSSLLWFLPVIFVGAGIAAYKLRK